MKKLIFSVFTGLSLIWAAPVSASFGDCTDPNYMRGFEDGSEGVDPSAPSLDINCVIEFEFEYSTPHGNRRIRAIRDINADWAFSEGSLEAVEAGARAAVDAMSQLGDFQVDDITLLILDDSFGRIDDAEDNMTGAMTVRARRNECLVDVYALSVTGTPRFLPFVIGHEIFHCIQSATLSRAQVRTSVSQGVWWAEGSADYFGALTDPESILTVNRPPRFDEHVQAGVPLYDMDYDAAIFFYWFHGERGPAQLLPFLRQMASDDTDAAQRAAMRATLSDDEWLRFVEAYAERTITTTAGKILTFTDEGEPLKFQATHTERFTLEPFAISHGWLSYACGEWENELRPDPLNFGALREGETGWGDLPDQIDTEGAGEMRYRYAAINTGDTPQAVAVEGTRIRSCEPCNGSNEIDICIVGEWEMTGGGPVEWARENGIPITNADVGQRIIRFDEQGTFFAKAFSGSLDMDFGDDGAHGEGQAFSTAGRWSVSRPDKKLAICQDSGGMRGRVQMTEGEIPVEQPPRALQVLDYACSKTTLNTSEDFGIGTPMDTTYTRLSPPPRELE